MKTDKALNIGLLLSLALLAAIMLYVRHERATITIGAILPLSGPAKSYGDDVLAGLRLLEDETNAEAKRTGKNLTVRIIPQDDQMDEKTALLAYQVLKQNNRLDGILGPISSSSALALAPLLEKDGLIMISPTASSPRLTGMSRYFFRIWPPDGAEAREMANFAYTVLQLRKLAIIRDNNDFGQSISEVFNQAFVALGGTIVRQDAFPSSTSDFRPLVRNAVAAGAQGIYAPTYHSQLAVLLRHAKEVAPSTPLLAASPAEDARLLQAAGVAAEGLLYTRPLLDPTKPSPLEDAFRQEFKNKYNAAPGPAASWGYDTGAILLYALNRVGKGADNISTFLRSLRDYHGVTGNISFDDRGEVTRVFGISTVKNQAFMRFEDANKRVAPQAPSKALRK